MKQRELTAFLDEYLNLAAFGDDYSNNGLQAEGPEEIARIGFAVDASLATFEKAAAAHCDLLIVHHGLSWGSEPRRFTGSDGRRLRFLFEHRLGVYAAHLPLDAHPEVGNNVCLARIAGIKSPAPFGFWHGKALGVMGDLPAGTTVQTLAAAFQQTLGGGRVRSYAPDGAPDRPVRRAGIMSGSGGLDTLKEAIGAGLDLVITGEMEHTMFHPARENGVTVLALGHYLSETVGVRALQKLFSGRWPVETIFLDFPTAL